MAAIEFVDPPKLKVRDERAIRKELLKVKGDHPEGLLTAENVIEAAQDESSAMHSQFQWDDTIAGHQYRLAQARSIIRHVVVTMPNDKSESVVPKFISLRSDRKKPGGGYRETADVLGNKELLAELEATAKNDIDGVLRRYEMLKDLCQRVRRAAGIKPKAERRPTAKKK